MAKARVSISSINVESSVARKRYAPYPNLGSPVKHCLPSYCSDVLPYSAPPLLLTLLTLLARRSIQTFSSCPFHADLVPLQSGKAEHPQKSPWTDFRRRIGLPQFGQSGASVDFGCPRASIRLAMSRSPNLPFSSKVLPCASIWLLSIFRARPMMDSMTLATTTASSSSGQRAYFLRCWSASFADSWTMSSLNGASLIEIPWMALASGECPDQGS